jgi:hypothetical protein
MKNKGKQPNRKLREKKYFIMEEANEAGMDNAWSVARRRNGYRLHNGETGWSEHSGKTIRDALEADGQQYSGGFVRISTNVGLAELLDIMNSYSFEPLLHNTDTLEINGVGIDIDVFRQFLGWHIRTQNTRRQT